MDEIDYKKEVISLTDLFRHKTLKVAPDAATIMNRELKEGQFYYLELVPCG